MKKNKTIQAQEDTIEVQKQKISDLKKELNEAKAKPHIKVVQRDLLLKYSSDTKGGCKAYPLVIWTAMMEMLTLGAPPSSIPGSIVSVVDKFSPQTKFDEVPKVNLVCNARTVIGIICELQRNLLRQKNGINSIVMVQHKGNQLGIMFLFQSRRY